LFCLAFSSSLSFCNLFRSPCMKLKGYHKRAGGLFTFSEKKQRKIGAQQQKCSRKNLSGLPTFTSWG
jgi:hypothetical protein